MAEKNGYLKSLSLKVASANYHRYMTVKGLNDTKIYPDPKLAAGSEFTAMMLTLHSCLDILAQWINLEYNVGLKESEASLYKVIKKIKNETVKNQLIELKEITTYLDDFCNYNKHRNIVQVKEYSYFVSQFQPYQSFDIDQFERNGNSHPPQTLDYQENYQYYLVTNQLNFITGIDLIKYKTPDE